MLEKIAIAIIKKSFRLSVWMITRFYNMGPYQAKVSALRNMPDGTLGKDIADCLDHNDLQLVPGYESHDLKHVVLNFKMTAVDEIRMQAFMLGNGNYSIPCFAILFFGAILLPNLWMTLYKDYSKGRKAIQISAWNIEDFAEKNTNELRKLIFDGKENKQPIYTMKAFIKTGAITSILTGIFGMIYCLPYLFSASVADLIGAGFPFLAGSILVGGGLLALSNMAQKQVQVNNPGI